MLNNGCPFCTVMCGNGHCPFKENIMTVKTDFEIKHFVQFTHLKGGTLEILHSKDEMYTAQYDGDAYKISQNALQKIKLLNQGLKIVNSISQ